MNSTSIKEQTSTVVTVTKAYGGMTDAVLEKNLAEFPQAVNTSPGKLGVAFSRGQRYIMYRNITKEFGLRIFSV